MNTFKIHFTVHTIDQRQPVSGFCTQPDFDTLMQALEDESTHFIYFNKWRHANPCVVLRKETISMITTIPKSDFSDEDAEHGMSSEYFNINARFEPQANAHKPHNLSASAPKTILPQTPEETEEADEPNLTSSDPAAAAEEEAKAEEAVAEEEAEAEEAAAEEEAEAEEAAAEEETEAEEAAAEEEAEEAAVVEAVEEIITALEEEAESEESAEEASPASPAPADEDPEEESVFVLAEVNAALKFI